MSILKRIQLNKGQYIYIYTLRTLFKKWSAICLMKIIPFFVFVCIIFLKSVGFIRNDKLKNLVQRKENQFFVGLI